MEVSLSKKVTCQRTLGNEWEGCGPGSGKDHSRALGRRVQAACTPLGGLVGVNIWVPTIFPIMHHSPQDSVPGVSIFMAKLGHLSPWPGDRRTPEHEQCRGAEYVISFKTSRGLPSKERRKDTELPKRAHIPCCAWAQIE